MDQVCYKNINIHNSILNLGPDNNAGAGDGEGNIYDSSGDDNEVEVKEHCLVKPGYVISMTGAEELNDKSLEECRNECSHQEPSSHDIDCVAFTYEKSTKICKLYKGSDARMTKRRKGSDYFSGICPNPEEIIETMPQNFPSTGWCYNEGRIPVLF